MGHGGRENDGNGGERVGRGEEGGAARIRGRGAEAEGVSGVSGREARGSGAAGALILPVAGEGVRRGLPLFRPRSGEQGRGRVGEVGWAGGRPSWARGAVGGAFSFFFFFACVLLHFLFICLFSFLFYFI